MPSVEDLDFEVFVCRGSDPVQEISEDDLKAIQEFKDFLEQRFGQPKSPVVE